MADAIVAATAFLTNKTLLTANDKHYRPIKEIDIKPFRP
jgi:predicted nucleic acid-binding protein